MALNLTLKLLITDILLERNVYTILGMDGINEGKKRIKQK